MKTYKVIAIILMLLLQATDAVLAAKFINPLTDISQYPSLIKGVDRYTTDKTEATQLYHIYGKCRQSGINPLLCFAIMQQESAMKPNAVNLNTNNTYDYGAWQVNSSNLSRWRFGQNRYLSHNVFDPVQEADMALEVLKSCKAKFGYSWEMVECYNKGYRINGRVDYRVSVKSKVASVFNTVKSMLAGFFGGTPAFADMPMPSNEPIQEPKEHIKKIIDITGNGTNNIRLRRPDGSEVVISLDEKTNEVVGMTVPSGSASQPVPLDLSPSNVDPKPASNKIIFVLSVVIYVVFTGYLLFMAAMNLRNAEFMYFMLDVILWFILSGVMYMLLQKMRVF